MSDAQFQPFANSQAPALPSGAAAASSAPSYRLFDSTSVLIAAVLGSPVAGAALIAANYRRLGRTSRARWTLLIGAGATIAAIFAGYRFTLPYWASSSIGIGLAVATKQAAEALQGKIVTEHATSGGRLSSRWIAAAAGLAGCLVVFGAILAAVLGANASSKVTIGTRDSVVFTGAATKKDAAAFGAALKSVGYLRDEGFTVLLSKDASGAAVSFVVQPAVLTQPGMIDAYEQVVCSAASDTIGLPLKLRLANSALQPLKEIPVGRIVVGTNDLIFYAGSATKDDAMAFGKRLTDAGFLTDRGVPIFLSREGSVTSLAFVVDDGAWLEPRTVAAFEMLIHGTASSIGGLPVRLQLLSTKMTLEKEEIVD